LHFGLHVAQGQDTKIPDFVKAAGQNMLQESADEFIGIKGNPFLRSIRFIIFVTIGDLVVFKGFDPLV